ncbi:putative uncharacterized protein DDB_G0282133 isoform X2 [Eurytemora carolleeae]|uniref:putative uncharacterized protein DDB_G0282133 isoform X2 n=1 Tax=Eurytemora carolleeae TaxID=1294199 RepID=UPI000C759B51|nr:putative uncharacterized protein DDB_G0282133 isoform X2 [Eurytemora carolleeae]|eukprot:XP_023343637.1 putative uncharacterized protein DDB_G0282133 isoform X2 [Eurytemora affinis]
MGLVQRLLLALLFVLVYTDVCTGTNNIYSNDTVTLKISDSTKSISGKPGTRHNLDFILTNHGAPGSFMIRQESREISGALSVGRVTLNSDDMYTIRVTDILLPSSIGEYLNYIIVAEREGSFNQRSSWDKPDINGGYNNGGYNNGNKPDINGGYNNGGINNGNKPDINGGYNNGGNNNGNKPDINGGYNNGGYNNGNKPDMNGGYNNGGNNGGYNNGGYNNGGGNGGYNSGGGNGNYNNGDKPDINGGYNNGGYNNGGYNNGGQSGGNGGYNSGDRNDDWNNNGGYHGGDENYLPPGYKTSAKVTVLVHVHDRYIPPDTILPRVATQSVENNCRPDSSCSQQTWRARFKVQDDNSGLYRVSVKDSNNNAPFWWKEYHPIGGREEVDVEALVSCCSTGVSLEVEDVEDNLLVAYENLSDFTEPSNLNIIIGISVGVGLLVLVALIALGAFFYRRKYQSVSQGE